MTEEHERLTQLRALPPIAPPSELREALRSRAKQRLERAPRSTKAASFAAAAVVVLYLSWAVHFTSALYP